MLHTELNYKHSASPLTTSLSTSHHSSHHRRLLLSHPDQSNHLYPLHWNCASPSTLLEDDSTKNMNQRQGQRFNFAHRGLTDSTIGHHESGTLPPYGLIDIVLPRHEIKMLNAITCSVWTLRERPHRSKQSEMIHGRVQ